MIANAINHCSLLTAHCIAETEDFAVVFKPARMHCAPIKQNRGNTLLDWYAAIYPPVTELSGKKEGEGGLLHRLDFETQGLVLFAKNQQSLDNLLKQQEQGNFVKEYSAICLKSNLQNSLFPDPCSPSPIESFFRPFGPGRKMVRPLTDADCKGKEVATDQGGYYRTEIIKVVNLNGFYAFTVRLKRGFRHQIRCHLNWIGFPVLNDPLYGEGLVNGLLALRASGLFFADPQTGGLREYRITPLEI